MVVLDAKNVTKTFDGAIALDSVSLSVAEGEAVAIIGPSGSGKSTLLRCFAQLVSIDSGEITICSKPMVTSPSGKAVYSPKDQLHEIQLMTGMVFQSFNLFSHFSVLENITNAQIHVLKRSKAEAEHIAISLLDKVSLADKANAYPFQLSGGQAQRVSIARALALSPKVLFFDEPTSALDPELSGEILRVIKDLAQESRTMIVVTHEMAFAREISDRIVFMEEGRAAIEGTPAQIFENTSSPRLRRFLEGMDFSSNDKS
ncbi:MAG: amino acid ABC transporter ATP-binding protein [Eubacteriaceae bacterium]|nr:amino acid ABC transporter ATP-binding protein [Eubacteriaceae bacterium]